MDQSVVQDDFVIGAQSPVASSQKPKVHCATCGSGFANQANLRRHEETKHTHNTPEAVAKRLQLKEYRKTNGRERRKNDRVYREKLQQTCRTYKMKRKAREAAQGGGHAGGLSNDAKPKDVSISVDTQLHEESDHVLGASTKLRSPVKKARATEKTTGVFQVMTMVLTNENITEFFTPKNRSSHVPHATKCSGAPRTKEQRLATPRSTVL